MRRIRKRGNSVEADDFISCRYYLLLVFILVGATIFRFVHFLFSVSFSTLVVCCCDVVHTV